VLLQAMGRQLQHTRTCWSSFCTPRTPTSPQLWGYCWSSGANSRNPNTVPGWDCWMACSVSRPANLDQPISTSQSRPLLFTVICEKLGLTHKVLRKAAAERDDLAWAEWLLGVVVCAGSRIFSFGRLGSTSRRMLQRWIYKQRCQRILPTLLSNIARRMFFISLRKWGIVLICSQTSVGLWGWYGQCPLTIGGVPRHWKYVKWVCRDCTCVCNKIEGSQCFILFSQNFQSRRTRISDNPVLNLYTSTSFALKKYSS